jgi:hypothetical protein
MLTISTNDSPQDSKHDEKEDSLPLTNDKEDCDEELERTVKLAIDDLDEIQIPPGELKLPQSCPRLNADDRRPGPIHFDSAPYLKEQWTPMDEVVSAGYPPRYRFEKEETTSPLMAFPLAPIPEKPTPVVCVNGLNVFKTSLGHIYNLFSNFGNIVRIYYTPSNTSCLVEYDRIEAASLAKLYLNSIPFLGSQLKVLDAKCDTIPVKSGNPSEYFVGSTRTHRFRDNRPLSINPPTCTLHVSNLVREVCNESLLSLFTQFGEIEAYKFLHEDPKNMCLIRFAFIEQAVDALASLHNFFLGGRNIQISFTRSKV